MTSLQGLEGNEDLKSEHALLIDDHLHEPHASGTSMEAKNTSSQGSTCVVLPEQSPCLAAAIWNRNSLMIPYEKQERSHIFDSGCALSPADWRAL